MTIKQISVIITILLLIALAFILFKPASTSSITSLPSKIITRTPSAPSPSPSPQIIIDQNTNLSEQLDKLTPEDFSSDYQKLKQETSQF